MPFSHRTVKIVRFSDQVKSLRLHKLIQIREFSLLFYSLSHGHRLFKFPNNRDM